MPKRRIPKTAQKASERKVANRRRVGLAALGGELAESRSKLRALIQRPEVGERGRANC